MKNLILSYATNAKWEDYYRFISSIRMACDSSAVDVAILTDVADERFSRAAIDHHVTLVPVENVWKWAQRSRVLNRFYAANIVATKLLARVAPSSVRPWLNSAHRRIVGDWMHPMGGRWFAYLVYLTVNSGYSMIMTSDLRDVYFQRNPFTELDCESLHVFNQTNAFGAGDLDSDWYRSVYGTEALRRVQGKPQLCAGTIIGCMRVFTRFLEIFTAELERHPRRPLDQAVANHVVLNQLGDLKVHRHPPSNDVVLTFDGDISATGWSIQDGQIVRGGLVIPVVHMYDRVLDTKMLVHSKFPVPA